jgi:hypothetical protein
MLSSRGRSGVRPSVLVVSLLAPALVVLAGCGSSSAGGTSSASRLPTPPICTQIGGVLGNGPDPDADPVGYAEAQITPLGAIHASSPALQHAITSLDSAFRHEFAANASPASKRAVRSAKRQINALCPGAAA